MRRFSALAPLAVAALALAVPAAAEPLRIDADLALVQDAGQYAAAFVVTSEEALGRLKAQQASIMLTERLRYGHRDRLVSIALEHRPTWGVVVRLAGPERPADFIGEAGGHRIPVRFVVGLTSTRAAALRLLDARRNDLPGLVPGYRGAGVDPETGGLVVMQRPSADLRPAAEVAAELAITLGLPVRIRRLEAQLTDSAAIGGGRVEGSNPDGRRFRCTTGFVVRNPAGQIGVTTAAHCPDNLSWRGPDGEERLLPMAGAWGTAEHDLQIHTGVGPAQGLVFSDTAKTMVRPVTGWTTRPQTRPGDWLCMRGESSGYACATVELVDFAPPGALCGGLCAASWVTVAGPHCRRGDSGAPFFLGTTAFGILKGGAYLADGGCAFSYYQSVDYLPDGWRIERASAAPAIAPD